MIRTGKAWPGKEFVKLLRQRLQLFGVGRDDASMYSENSIKRGSVQIWRSLGLTVDQIQEISEISEYESFSQYAEKYNDCDPNRVPYFKNIQEFVRHAESVREELDEKYED